MICFIKDYIKSRKQVRQFDPESSIEEVKALLREAIDNGWDEYIEKEYITINYKLLKKIGALYHNLGARQFDHEITSWLFESGMCLFPLNPFGGLFRKPTYRIISAKPFSVNLNNNP